MKPATPLKWKSVGSCLFGPDGEEVAHFQRPKMDSVKDAAFAAHAGNMHWPLIEELRDICENSRLLLTKLGASGYRITESGEMYCDPWTRRFEKARAILAEAQKGGRL